jgi:hypothetical protein
MQSLLWSGVSGSSENKIKSYAERLNSFRKIGDLDLSFRGILVPMDTHCWKFPSFPPLDHITASQSETWNLR